MLSYFRVFFPLFLALSAQPQSVEISLQVVPAGREVHVRIQGFQPSPWHQRASTILNGDFTPIDRPLQHFGEMILPYSTHHPFKKSISTQNPANDGGVVTRAKQQAVDQINARVNAAAHGAADIIRGPGKLERLKEFAVGGLPYHPRWERKGARYGEVAQAGWVTSRRATAIPFRVRRCG